MLYLKSTYKEYLTFALLSVSMLYLCCCCCCCRRRRRRRCVFARYLVKTSGCDISHRLFTGWFLKWWIEDWEGGSCELDEVLFGVKLKGPRKSTATSVRVARNLTETEIKNLPNTRIKSYSQVGMIEMVVVVKRFFIYYCIYRFLFIWIFIYFPHHSWPYQGLSLYERERVEN
jgi:hypothetical protein